jgi:hypothetical protein
MASSKLFFEVEVISLILATDIWFSFSGIRRSTVRSALHPTGVGKRS